MLPHFELLKLMLNVNRTSNIQGRELYYVMLQLYFRTGLRRGICESICIKLGMAIDTTKRYSIIKVWMTLCIHLVV